MENPYQSPEEPCTSLDGRAPMEPDRRPRGLVYHVRVVAILMLVQGALELLAALVFGAFAAVIGPMMSQVQKEAQPPMAPAPEQVFWIMTATYGVMAAAALIVAVLHIVAGLRNYRFRGRTVGFVALAGGLLAFFTCYCLPTAVALSIYGLIVYLNGSVSEAFCMGESGCSPNEIITTFQR